jgi:hypothetical protein
LLGSPFGTSKQALLAESDSATGMMTAYGAFAKASKAVCLLLAALDGGQVFLVSSLQSARRQASFGKFNFVRPVTGAHTFLNSMRCKGPASKFFVSNGITQRSQEP